MKPALPRSLNFVVAMSGRQKAPSQEIDHPGRLSGDRLKAEPFEELGSQRGQRNTSVARVSTFAFDERFPSRLHLGAGIAQQAGLLGGELIIGEDALGVQLTEAF